jgi:endonuclease/exonuclease/phosphatase family metal-dependent hydrolase
MARLDAAEPDVAVLTEARVDLAERHWPHVMDVGPHPRSGQPRGSKVVIASRVPLTLVDDLGSSRLPARNFLAVDVDSPSLGRVRIIGIVVRYAERARYIDAFPEALAACVTSPTVLAGDFNLAMTGSTTLERRLRQVLDDHDLRIVTLGPHPALAGERPLIDHIAITSDLAAADRMVWAREDPTRPGRSLTDHAGTAVSLVAGNRGPS